MTSPLSELGVTLPVIAAPMAGGPTTVDMVLAAARAGSFGFLAAGYKTCRGDARGDRPGAFGRSPVRGQPVRPQQRSGRTRGVPPLRGRDTTRGRPIRTHAAGRTSRGRRRLRREDRRVARSAGTGRQLHVRNPGRHRDPQPAVIRHARHPDRHVRIGGRAGRQRGVDALAVQSAFAGGSFGTLTPERRPPKCRWPTWSRRSEVTSACRSWLPAAWPQPRTSRPRSSAGAAAVAVGTVLLRARESGASATHRGALTDPARTETVVTQAFTGRPARGLRNVFIDTYEARAPLGYPAIHHLTSPLRKAAAAAGQPDLVHLWAGTGYRHATDESTGQILHTAGSRALRAHHRRAVMFRYSRCIGDETANTSSVGGSFIRIIMQRNLFGDSSLHWESSS